MISKQIVTCIKENKQGGKNPTQNSTQRRHKALYGEKNIVHWQPLASQTSQDHIFLQRHTEKPSHISRTKLIDALKK